MPRIVEGNLSAAGLRLGIVCSRFNSFITDRLVDGALDAIKRSGGDPETVTIFRTPGSFEIPAVTKRVAKSGEFDAVICLGAVIRGATPHFEYIAAEVTKGIAQVLLELGLSRIRLMTDNPKRLVGLRSFGLEVVERVPLVD